MNIKPVCPILFFKKSNSISIDGTFIRTVEGEGSAETAINDYVCSGKEALERHSDVVVIMVDDTITGEQINITLDELASATVAKNNDQHVFTVETYQGQALEQIEITFHTVSNL